MLNAFFTLCALLFIVVMLVQIMAIQAFFNRMNKAHHELYMQMDRPRWKIQLADDAFRDGLKYIRSKKFRELDDTELESIYKKIKMTDYAAIGLGVTAMAIVIYQAVVFS